MRRLILKLGGIPEESDTLLKIFQILLKANPRAAFVLDSKGRLLLHYASKYLKSVSCGPKIIEALLSVNLDGAKVVDNDECYAITTAGELSVFVEMRERGRRVWIQYLFCIFLCYTILSVTLM